MKPLREFPSQVQVYIITYMDSKAQVNDHIQEMIQSKNQSENEYLWLTLQQLIYSPGSSVSLF